MKNNKSGRINASTKRTVTNLSKALFELLEKNSFEKITIIDICNEAQIPRATFYNHFEDKYDLLRFALKSFAADIASTLPECNDEREETIQLVSYLLDFAEKNYSFLKKISSANYNSILFAEVKNLFYEDILKNLSEHEAAGRPYKINIKIIAEFYSNAIVYSAKSWLENDMNIPKEDVFNSLVTLVDLS